MATTSLFLERSATRAWICPIGTSCEPAMRALSCSQGSRTSSSSGLSRLLSASHAASSAGLICLINSELEARRPLGVDQRPDHRLEKVGRTVLAGRDAGDEA